MPRAPSPTTRPGSALAYEDSRFGHFAGIEVHHHVRGHQAAPGILLSHHFYGSARTWRPVMDELAQDHLVAAFDRPGFGLTQRPSRDLLGRWSDEWGPHGPYSRDTAARIGWELLDHLEVTRPVLVGSSAGGTNVLEMYARRPEDVRALVLVSPAITGDVGPPAGMRRALRSRVVRGVAPIVARRFAGDISPERISRSWHDPSLATHEHAEPYRRMLQVEGWDRGFWELMTAEDPPDLRSVVRDITVPTLVVSGSSDRIISPHWSQRTASAIPHGRFELLRDVGHTPQEEAPHALVAAIRRFLRDLH